MGNERDALFYELYDAYFQDVYRFVYQMVRDKEQVEDLLQEIFLLVYKNLKRFRGESEYKTYNNFVCVLSNRWDSFIFSFDLDVLNRLNPISNLKFFLSKSLSTIWVLSTEQENG